MEVKALADNTEVDLNIDGTIHDKHRGVPKFGKDERDFLFCYGWNIEIRS